MQEMPLERNKICKISWGGGGIPLDLLQARAFGAKKTPYIPSKGIEMSVAISQL